VIVHDSTSAHNGTPAASDFVDQVLALRESDRIAELLDRSNDYMRNAHLLPARDEFETVDEYVRLLQRFQRAPATQVSFYRFLPTPNQRRANADVLARWEAAQRKPRSGDDDRRKRALGLLHTWCFVHRSRGRPALGNVQEGERDAETRDAMRYLAPLVNEGHLTSAELHNAIIDASERNGHIPGNKSRSFVERQIDAAIAKFTEPFSWGRLDKDVR
jgi:hypothetical protein